MLNSDIKLKIRENKVKASLSTPRFIITYSKSKENMDAASQVSFSIISQLNDHNDILIEVNSSLMSAVASERENEVFSFIQKIKEMNLNYRYRQLPGSTTGNIFSNILKKGSSTEHDVLVYIPNDIYSQDSFNSILPKNGDRKSVV
jgi:hypothetical protein